MPSTDNSIIAPLTAMLQVQFPNGDDLYDQLMADIEPDLLSVNIAYLEEKYHTESEAEAKARGERYTKAFEAYDKKLQEYLGDLQQKVHGYQRTAFKSAEQHDRDVEKNALQNIESSFSSL